MMRAYISVIEEKINRICGDNISCFESKVTPEFMFHWQGMFSRVMLIIITFYAVVFVMCIMMALEHINTIFFGALLMFELLVSASVLVLVLKEPEKITALASKVILKQDCPT